MLVGTLEAAHRFQKDGARTSGEVIGLFGFGLPGPTAQRDWARAAVSLEDRVAGGHASVMLNATHRGEPARLWLSATWRWQF